MPLQDPPAVEDLLQAVREYLQEEVLPSADVNQRVHVLMAMNVVGVVERELVLGPKLEQEHVKALNTLGVNSEAELAQAIKSGALDAKRDEVLKVLRQTTIAKLTVASPAFLERTRKEAELAAQRQAKKAEAAQG